MQRYVRSMVCWNIVSLTKIAKQYTDDSPGYVIQSWMRSRNTLEFLRQWENDMNKGKGGGMSAYPEIVADFHL